MLSLLALFNLPDPGLCQNIFPEYHYFTQSKKDLYPSFNRRSILQGVSHMAAAEIPFLDLCYFYACPHGMSIC